MNAEFQRRPKRDKKAFLGDQCKEIEENNGMRKSRDLFKKIRDTKGTFHANMGTIKDRNCRDLTEASGAVRREKVLSILVDPKVKVAQSCLILRYPMD